MGANGVQTDNDRGPMSEFVESVNVMPDSRRMVSTRDGVVNRSWHQRLHIPTVGAYLVSVDAVVLQTDEADAGESLV